MTKMIAHRGCSAVAPENTMTAFTLAWAHDCDGIELDVQVSRDGKVVVHHDPDTGRTGNAALKIATTDWEVLRNMDVGSHKDARFGGERIPLLTQVLKLMPTGKLIQIEIKPEVTQMAPILEILREIRCDIEVFVLSCDREKLAAVQQAVPEIALLQVIDQSEAQKVDAVIAQAKQQRLKGVAVDYRGVDRAYVEKVHQAGLLLGVWTVNDPKIVQKFLALQVDMIASDTVQRM